MLAVPDRADHGDQLALRDVGLSAYRAHPFDDGIDLRLRRALSHHDHHLFPKPLRSSYVGGGKADARRRPAGDGSSRWRPWLAAAGRLAKSPIRVGTARWAHCTDE